MSVLILTEIFAITVQVACIPVNILGVLTQVFAIAIEVLSVGFDIRLAVCLLEVLAV
ncbi:MAG: hypothetical protein LAO21_01610 [Acidobacteriia bacterium]|nr:hypothetical protein [Terriglobia bacterium]